jgi:hypothetical protein
MWFGLTQQNWVTLEALSFSGLLVDPNNHTADVFGYDAFSGQPHTQQQLPLECAHQGLRELVLFDCSSLEHELWDPLAKRRGQVGTGREICRYIEEWKENNESEWMAAAPEATADHTSTSLRGGASSSNSGGGVCDSYVQEHNATGPTLLRTYHMQARSPEGNGHTAGYDSSWMERTGTDHERHRMPTRTIRLHVTHRSGESL